MDDCAKNQHDRIVLEAYLWNGGKWPKQLTSGHMFFRGEQIRYNEFVAAGCVPAPEPKP